METPVLTQVILPPEAEPQKYRLPSVRAGTSKIQIPAFPHLSIMVLPEADFSILPLGRDASFPLFFQLLIPARGRLLSRQSV